MIPQSIKDIISNGEYTGIFNTIAMILFILFFLAIVWRVLSRPKKYYNDEENAPLDDDNNQLND